MNDTKTTLLDHRQFPDDLQHFSLDELTILAQEIRDRLISIGDHCGGHLASNLGVVELTLALHTIFQSPRDKFIWDTSHQAYVHKMLTGRLDQMYTIRQKDGLSGFANIFESEHDTFGAGHASTSLSAGIGVAQARNIKQENYGVVSIIGDSSLSGGMAFEALNNLDELKGNFICILNDNNMSISHPVGCMASYMTKIRQSALYDVAKKQFSAIMNKIPRVGTPLLRRIEKAIESMRGVILDSTAGVLFEEFGFKYLGPIDGHDFTQLMSVIQYAKDYPGPILIHIITKKGKGHEIAESNPVKYHGISPKPDPTQKPVSAPLNYQKLFGQTMIDLANKHPDLAVITPAMKGGSCLNEYADLFPDRFFDVGIAEEHAVTFAAGLARAGVRPVLSIYSTFLQRGFDQVIHDVCLQKLPVIFALDRAGFVGQDGATHQGVFDYGFLLMVPEMTVLAPKDGVEMKHLFSWALTQPGPVSIRYPKEVIPELDGTFESDLSDHLLECLLDSESDQDDLLILGVGSMALPAYQAGKLLAQRGHRISVINLRCIKPLDTDFLTPFIDKAKHILIIEEGCAIGGVYHYVLQQFKAHDRPLNTWHQLAIPDEFVEHGSIPEQRRLFDLDVHGIVNRGKVLLGKKVQAPFIL